MKSRSVRKIVSFISSISLLLQSFLPFVMVMPVYAEGDNASESAVVEISPTPEVTPEVSLEISSDEIIETTPTPETTVTLEPSHSVEVTPEATSIIEPTPDVIVLMEATPSVDPVAIVTSEIIPEVTVSPLEKTSASSEPQVLSSQTETPQETIAPPVETPLTENLTIVDQLEQAITPESTPTLSTDKSDYFPTDTVHIFGTNFQANTKYILKITSSDNPVFNYSPEVSSDENGNISLSFVLDGNYRPNYQVEAFNITGTMISSHSFTDSAAPCGYSCPIVVWTWTTSEVDVDQHYDYHAKDVVQTPGYWGDWQNGTRIPFSTVQIQSVWDGSYSLSSRPYSNTCPTGYSNNGSSCQIVDEPSHMEYSQCTSWHKDGTCKNWSNWSNGSCQNGAQNNICIEKLVQATYNYINYIKSYNNCPTGSEVNPYNSTQCRTQDMVDQYRLWIDTIYQCPAGYSNNPGQDNCRKWINTTYKDVDHSAAVLYEKSNDPHKCHRPSDSDLGSDYGMDHDTVQSFKAVNGEWKDSTLSLPNDQYVDESGVCHAKTPVCTDPVANNDQTLTDQTYSDISLCTYDSHSYCSNGETILVADNMTPPTGATYGACQSCVDTDNDGVCDTKDNCRVTSNSNQADDDGDLIGNSCDNCPSVVNPNQADSNGDGEGDACTDTRKVTICHYTNENSSHQLNEIDVSISSVASSLDWLEGQNGHGSHTGDIWPQFNAKNGNLIASYGDQETLANHCVPVVHCTENQYMGDDNVCYDKTPVCTDESATNYTQTSSHTYSNNEVCKYNPILSIIKSNDATSDKTPGSAVNFTIKLHISDGDANTLSVEDLLPKGIVYRTGSYHATVNGVPVDISEPTYHSPGTWSLANIPEGADVELTYTADINSDIEPGTYSDLAWAVANENVYATGNLSDNFTGTEVSVIKDQTRSEDYSVEKEEVKKGEVLGASTSLPATGASPSWLLLAFVCLVYGIRFIKSSNKK